MPKTLEEALAALETAENGAELVDAVKTELSKKNSEAKGLRDRVKAADVKLKKLEKLTSAFELDGVDDEELDEKINAIKTKQKTAKSPEEVSRLEKRIKLLEEEATNAKVEARKSKVDSALSKVLHDAKVVESVFGGLKDVLSTRIRFKDDGSYFFDVDGEEKTLEDGVKGYLAANPGFVKNEQAPGSGGGTGKRAPGGKVMKETEFLALPHDQRMALSKEGVTLT